MDLSTDIGRIRLRTGDVSSLPFLDDATIHQTINDSGGDLVAAAKTCAQYILAQLSFRSHKKMVQLEVWGGEAFANYRQFLIDTVSNPAMMSYSPVAYGGSRDASTDPLAAFVEDWNHNWTTCTVTETMSSDAWFRHICGGC